MKEESNTFTVAASSLDYSNLVVDSDSCVISNHEIPLEKVNGAIDRFEEETKARKQEIEIVKFLQKTSEQKIFDAMEIEIVSIKKRINNLKYSLLVTRTDLLDAITKNNEESTKEIHELKKTLLSYMVITLFLTIGFIYCIINL